MSLLIKMKLLKDVTPAERVIVDYILENPKEVPEMTIRELAKETFTSPSSITRVVRMLGFSGFLDFKVKLSAETNALLAVEELTNEQLMINDEDSIDDVIDKVTNYNIKALKTTRRLNNGTTYLKVIELIETHNYIDFYGVGISNTIAQDAVIKGLRLGLYASAYGDNAGNMMVASKIADKKRLVFLISYSGETDTVVECARNLIKSGVTTISITSNTKNTLAKLCNINLYVDVTDSIYQIGAMSSRLAILNILDVIFSAYANTDKDILKDILKSTHTYDTILKEEN